jgi:beta-galactosidase/beta-glucuronidase
MVRPQWLNLNGLWQFAVAKENDEPPVGKDLAQEILVPFPVQSALSGVMKPAERVWYRRTFELKKDWAGRRILLHFGAVNWEATVWLNGYKLGSHQGGYDGFSFDITDVLKADGPQELIVGVWNPIDGSTQPRGKQVRKPGGIFYTASTGIWQTVWLEPVGSAYIRSIRIDPDVDHSRVRLTVNVHRPVVGQKIVAQARAGREPLPAVTGPVDRVFDLAVPRPRLWSPESPFLYDLRVELRQGDQVLDRIHSYFGLRKVEVGKDDHGVTRILLNGKPYFQVGPLDQGFWPDGLYTAPTDAALRYDIDMTKKLGLNLARKHVKVEPDRWYYWCDKLGLLVWQDMPSGDRSVAPGKGDIVRTPASARQYERELRRMIDGRRNHPCIIMWVPFNEGWGQYDTARITALVKDLDPTRLVDCASGWNDRQVGDVHDIHVYPGPGSPEPESHRAAVLGEFGGLGLGVDGHTWSNKTWGYRGTADQADLTRRYERLLRRVWELKDKPGLSAAVYTQTTDVETEANGLMTYDRAVVKVDLERAAAANRGDFSRVPEAQIVVASSKEKGISWRYTFEQPARDWFKPDFADSEWKEGPGGFGSRGTPGAVVRTEWKTNDIWLRREFSLPEVKADGLYLWLHHDDDAEVYLNGVLATKIPGYTTDYEDVSISAAARATLKPGKNHLAVHCHQRKGGQYIDVGLVEFRERGR